MSKFKIGDKVICVDNSNVHLLNEGEIYTVSALDSDVYDADIFIGLLELGLDSDNDFDRWSIDRFILFTSDKPTKDPKSSIEGLIWKYELKIRAINRMKTAILSKCGNVDLLIVRIIDLESTIVDLKKLIE